MVEISKLVESLSPSATLAMSARSQQMRAEGIDVINMSVGEPDFPTPTHIKEAAKKAIDDNFTRYTPVAGYSSLREAISRRLEVEGLRYAPSQIVVASGAKQALFDTVLAVVNPGDEVVIPMPAWVSYVEMVKIARGEVVTIKTGLETDFKITPTQLEAALTEKTRLIMFNSPSNPTGSVYSRDELAALVEVLERYPQVVILSDEIYQHINFTGSFTSMASFPSIADRVVLINGVSKAFAMTGWRIGFSASSEKMAKALTKLQGQTTSNASSIAQKASEAAYNGSWDCVEEMCVAFRRRRDLIFSLVSEIPGVETRMPHGAFYLFPKMTTFLGTTAPDGRVIKTSGDLAMYLLECARVATVDGAAFGAEGYIRLSYATDDETIREAVRRIAESLSQLKH